MIQHKFQSTVPDAVDATLVRTQSNWNGEAHTFTGGSNGQVPIRDSESPEGATFGWRVNAVPVTSLAEIPNGTLGFAEIPEAGGMRRGIFFNNNGDYLDISSRLDPT